MSKYKVGDRVRIADAEKVKGDWNFSDGMKKWCGKVMTVRDFSRGFMKMVEDVNDFHGNLMPGWDWADNFIAGYADEKQKIVITTDGKTTLARLYDGNKVIKSAEAKCNPSDTFAFFTGAKWAFDRLTEESKPTEAKKPEPVKLYCAADGLGFRKIKKGDICEFEPGVHFRFPNGETTPVPYKTIDEFCQRNPGYAKAKFVPLVKRPAKVGEWIFPSATWNANRGIKTPTIYQVEGIDRDGDAWFGNDTLCANTIVGNGLEYLVLDGYKPKGK